jgi:hypothetical protein
MGQASNGLIDVLQWWKESGLQSLECSQYVLLDQGLGNVSCSPSVDGKRPFQRSRHFKLMSRDIGGSPAKEMVKMKSRALISGSHAREPLSC